MNDSGVNIIFLFSLTILGFIGAIAGYISDHLIQFAVFIFLFILIIRLNKKINLLERGDSLVEKMNQVYDSKIIDSLRNDAIIQSANYESMKERYAKEFVGKVSTSFDGNNEWIGYEYIMELSPSHTVIKYVSDGGEIKQFKHIFDNAPYDCKTDDEFKIYMTAIKARAYNYNAECINYSKRKPIDFRSSIEDDNFIENIVFNKSKNFPNKLT
jgi:hypothetical protein